jgi:hypothetical protein
MDDNDEDGKGNGDEVGLIARLDSTNRNLRVLV